MSSPIPYSIPSYDAWKTTPDPDPPEPPDEFDIADQKYAEMKERDDD
jgi:hypothetical protein